MGLRTRPPVGAIRLGAGAKTRLRFDLDTATTAIKNLQDPAPQGQRPEREAPAGDDTPQTTAYVPLLPVHEPRTRGILARVTRTGRRR